LSRLQNQPDIIIVDREWQQFTRALDAGSIRRRARDLRQDCKSCHGAKGGGGQ